MSTASEILEHLIASGETCGCNVWLCQCTGQLRKALTDVKRTEKELEACKKQLKKSEASGWLFAQPAITR